MPKQNKQITIFDTTLRDGEQSPGFSMNTAEKIQIAKQLDQMKVDIIEAGFPVSSKDQFEAVEKISELCQFSEVCGLARVVEKDIKAVYESTKKAKKARIHVFSPTSEIQLKYQLRKTQEEVLDMSVKAVKLAKSLSDRVDFSPMDATRTDKKYLYQIIKAVIEAGADTINVPDSVGYSTPEEFAELIKDIQINVPEIKNCTISVHCQNDLGMATANSLSAILAGAGEIQCTINGIGERAGNTSLEEVAMAIKTRSDFYNAKTNIDTTKIYPASKLVTAITGVGVQPNKAIVGANAFAHESGIHQDGVLKHRETWEIMNPKDIGLAENKLVLGKHSGRHAIKSRLADLGYILNEKELVDFYKRFKDLADKKKEIFDQDLRTLMTAGSLADFYQETEIYKLENLDVKCGTNEEPKAEVCLSVKADDFSADDFSPQIKTEIKNGRLFLTVSSKGDGPVDATYSAINKIINLSNNLQEYAVNAVTEGVDAQATVSLRVEINNKTVTSSSSHTDITVASCQAYLQCLNRGALKR